MWRCTGPPVADVAEVAAASEITITSLPTPDAVAGVAAAWAAPTAGASCSTSRPRRRPATGRWPRRWPATGHHFVEAPLTGGAIGAQNRSLVFMVGGDDEPVARCLPMLDRLGRATFHLGPVGAGTTMKLVNSLLAFACTWASLEGLSLAAARRARPAHRGRGRAHRRGVELLHRPVGRGHRTRGKPPEFALALAAKDARLIEESPASRRPGAGGRGGGAGCWPTPSSAASATTTGATSSSPPRPGRRPLTLAPPPRGRADRGPRPRSRTGYFTVPDDPAEPPRLLGSRCRPAASTSSPAGSCAPGASPRAATTSCWADRPALHLDLRPRAAVRQEGRPVGAYGVGQVDLPEGPRVQAILARRARRLPDRHGARARPRDPAHTTRTATRS